MVDWPTLCVLLLTYTDDPNGPRAQYASRTLHETLDGIAYSGPLWVHIADDGSPEEHRQNMIEIVHGYDHIAGATMTNAQRSGYGASYNLATQIVHRYAQIVLPLEDDWSLSRPMNIDAYVMALMDGTFNCIRLGYLGFTEPLYAELLHHTGITYMRFHPESPEHHVCAGHPRLETVEWERQIGPWPEHENPGMTERLWCGRKEARVGVGWPLDAPTWGIFQHIGTVQARADQYIGVV